jgi:hypothetical protein
MRIVGTPKPSPIPSPQEAWERGRALDAMLPSMGNQRPLGVWRLSHTAANQMDDELMLQTARRFVQQQVKPRVQA